MIVAVLYCILLNLLLIFSSLFSSTERKEVDLDARGVGNELGGVE